MSAARHRVSSERTDAKSASDARQVDGWAVVDHDRDDALVRGPFADASTAGAVRRELELHPPYDTTGNLWIVPARLGRSLAERAPKPAGGGAA